MYSNISISQSAILVGRILPVRPTGHYRVQTVLNTLYGMLKELHSILYDLHMIQPWTSLAICKWFKYFKVFMS